MFSKKVEVFCKNQESEQELSEYFIEGKQIAVFLDLLDLIELMVELRILSTSALDIESLDLPHPTK